MGNCAACTRLHSTQHTPRMLRALVNRDVHASWGLFYELDTPSLLPNWMQNAVLHLHLAVV